MLLKNRTKNPYQSTGRPVFNGHFNPVAEFLKQFNASLNQHGSLRAVWFGILLSLLFLSDSATDSIVFYLDDKSAVPAEELYFNLAYFVYS